MMMSHRHRPLRRDEEDIDITVAGRLARLPSSEWLRTTRLGFGSRRCPMKASSSCGATNSIATCSPMTPAASVSGSRRGTAGTCPPYYARSEAEVNDLAADQLEHFPELVVPTINALEQAGFTVTVGDPAFDADIDQGDILRTDPGPGAKVDPNAAKIFLVPSDAVTVPKLTDGTVGQAKDRTVLLKCFPESRPSAPTVAVRPQYFCPDPRQAVAAGSARATGPWEPRRG